MSSKPKSPGLQESIADCKTRLSIDKHRENFEDLKAHHINQQEAYQSLQQQYATLSDQYEQLHTKSQEIITTLQEERDQRVAEYENLRAQVLTTQQLEQMKYEWVEKVEQHLRKNNEVSQSEVETLRGEYNTLVCSYTYLKSEYESTLVSHQCEIKDMKTKHDTEISSLAEKLRLALKENDAVVKVQRIRELQKRNTELEQKILTVEDELEEMQTKYRNTVSQNDKVISEQSEHLKIAQTRIKSLEVECSTLSSSLESVQTEISDFQEKKMELQTMVEQAHRETSRVQRELDGKEDKHKLQISDLEMKLTKEYQKLREGQECILREKQACEAQIELLQRTVHEYESLLASKEHELELQMQALRQSEWEKRVALEQKITVLEEKLVDEQRVKKMEESKSKSDCTKLQDHIQQLITKNKALEAELVSLKTHVQQRNEKDKVAEMELHMLQEMGYKKEYKILQSEHKSLHQTKEELESKCAKLQSTVSVLEQAVSDASKEVIRITETHQQARDKERNSWQQEKEMLLSHIDEEKAHMRGLVTDVEDEKNHSKRLQRHYKRKMCDLKDSVKLTQAKQAQVLTEKEALKKSLGLENMKLKNELTKLKRRQDEFCVLLQTDCFATTGALAKKH